MQHEWWRGAVIYQVYPRSFADSNSDGIGDLRGIIGKMPYLASLGVQALWISPFFKSPMRDFGYDIADYRAIDPMFGSMDDFDALIESAHGHGLRIIIDQVFSHTSIDHEWFAQSRQSQDNPKSDWYVWADAKPDGSAPNNWLSIFGGNAWQWDSRRKQYYLHNFLVDQPDLNFHNPEVQEAVLDNVKFWLDKGVDGFRLDAFNFCFHDRELRDNPAKPPEARTGRGYSPDNPYAFQYHYHNNTQPEMIPFIRRLRALFDQYEGITTVAELNSEDSLATMAEYSGPDKLHMGYSFELAADEFSVQHIRDTVRAFESRVVDGYPCWSISNHDVQRVMTRWLHDQAPPYAANLLNAMLLSLRGSVCVYQGQELGLPEADVAFEDLQDPFGVAFWPAFKGRDGCRTPMPWANTLHGDFMVSDNGSKPWLPVDPRHLQLSVDTQEHHADSVLVGFRRFTAWRASRPELTLGSITMLDTAEPVLAFTRTHEGSTLFCAFNLSGTTATLSDLPKGLSPLDGHGLTAGALTDDGLTLELPAYGLFYSLLPEP